ncbi:MAG TPA: hypothetical protein VEX86_12665 [Longimicrobium sp.]|nr:hypothetical protein [Longimicrobium sp.]
MYHLLAHLSDPEKWSAGETDADHASEPERAQSTSTAVFALPRQAEDEGRGGESLGARRLIIR